MDAETRRRREAQHLTRLGTGDDVAYAAVYLASRESEFLTGINLALDGGSSAARGAVLG
jgi:NAD(P)-dependent dehydrogenase (short-subunit alcohol dehydrogenase family)